MTQGDTYVRTDWTYDENGNALTEKYYDADGNPVACEAGYDELRYEYAESGLPVRADFLLNGESVMTKAGFAAVTRAYNEQGKVILEAYYDTEGQPAKSAGGYYAIRRSYDAEGNITEETKIKTLEELQYTIGTVPAVYSSVVNEKDRPYRLLVSKVTNLMAF